MHKGNGMENYRQAIKVESTFMQQKKHVWLMGIGFLYLLSHEAWATAPTPDESLDDIYQRVFGKAENIPTELYADLRIMGKLVGGANIQTDGSQITHLPAALLQASLESYLKPELYQKLTTALSQTTVSLQQLQTVGVSATYHRLDLAVDVKIQPKSLNRRMRSVLSALAGQGSIIPERLAEPAKISGYLNFFSDLSYQEHQDGGDTTIQARLDSALNVHGFVLEQQYTYRPDTSNQLIRNHTRFVIDDVENESRYQLGDIQIRGRNLQSGMSLGGFQWQHDMDWPTAQTYRPQGNYRFTLDSSAEVQVYQDGKLTNTVHLNAGEHTLDSIQATQGIEIELKIKNDFGQTSTQRFSRFTDSRLLHPDVSRYAISVGFPSDYKSDGLHYNTQRKVVSGYYQQGITETLTAGVDLQTDGTHHQVGADALWATRLGNISAGVTQTRKQQKKGHALRLQISPPARPVTPQQGHALNWAVAFERYSQDFQPFSLSTDMQPYGAKWLANAQLSQTFSTGLSAGMGITQSVDFSGNSRRSLQASASKQLSKRLSLSLSAQQQRETSKPADHSFQLSLSIALDPSSGGRPQGLSAAYNDFNQGSQLNYYLGSKGSYGLDSLSSSAKLESNQGYRSISLDTRWQQPTWDGAASWRYGKGEHNPHNSTHLNLNTALVFADGAVARSKTVSDSFAILEAPTGLQQPMAASQGKSLFTRPEHAPDGLPQRYDALIPPGGTASLAHLGSYSVQHISTDSQVLPDNLDLNATEFDVLPDYKSGYRLKVGGERGVDLHVRVVDPHGNPAALQAAHLVAANHAKQLLMIFTDADGVIRVPNLAQGRYRLEWLNRPASQPTWIDITAAAGQTQTLELRTP